MTTKKDLLAKVSKEMYNKTYKEAKLLDIELPPLINAKLYTTELLADLGSLDFQTNNRWTVSFPKKFNIPKDALKTFLRPSYPFYDSESFSLELHDKTIEQKSITQRLIKLSTKAVDFSLTLEMLDPTGKIICTWLFKMCNILKMDWSKLDYSDSNICTIKLDIDFVDLKIK